MFCAGADLIEFVLFYCIATSPDGLKTLIRWNKNQNAGTSSEQQDLENNKNGFATLSRRQTSKVIIAAVNGGAYGGGMEILLNCDLIIAAEGAKFALPEVKRGVLASQGGMTFLYVCSSHPAYLSTTGIPRLTQIAGHQVPLSLLSALYIFANYGPTARCGTSPSGSTCERGRCTAQVRIVSENHCWHLASSHPVNMTVPPDSVNRVVKASQVVDSAIEMAKQITMNSPDAVQATKQGLLLTQSVNMAESVSQLNWSAHSTQVYRGENIKVMSFFRQHRTSTLILQYLHCLLC